ncbi:hypothetical protein PM085_21040, partial [Halorubrum ezzemoulense]
MSTDGIDLSEKISTVPATDEFTAPDLPPFEQDQLEYDRSEYPISDRNGVEVRRAVIKGYDVSVALKQV